MTKRAVLIGCNYSAIPGVQLRGCINDIVNVRNMLVDAYGYLVENVTILRDDVATSLPNKANILAALNTVIAQSSVGDEIWIHYSGHGTQVNDTSANPDEPQDEAIVPCDFQSAGFIIDDDLFDIIKISIATTIIVFDSCHSGTAVDLEYTMNYENGVLSNVVNNNKKISNPNIFMFSGCRDSQTSSDAFSNFEQEPVGAFTDSLLETLRANRHNASIVKVYSDICLNLSKNGFSQIPCLSSTVPTPIYTFKGYNASASTVTQSPIVTQTPTVTQTPYKVQMNPTIQTQGVFYYKVQNNSISKLSTMPPTK